MPDYKVWLIGSIFFLLPLAHLKWTLLGLPFYAAEIPLLIASGLFWWQSWGQWGERISWLWKKHAGLLVASSIFLLGATLSTALNDPELGNWGRLKSFFVLPVFFLWLLVLETRLRLPRHTLLWLWFSGLALAAWAGLVMAWNGWLTYDNRLMAWYDSPNELAMLLAPGLLLALFFGFNATKKSVRLGSFFFGSLLLVALGLTQSYGAWLALLIASGLFVWLARFQLRLSGKGILFMLGAIIMISFVFVWPTEKFQTLLHLDERSSLASRGMIWESALAIARDNPIFGIGPGNFQEWYLKYQKFFSPYLEWAVPEPHNAYLALLLATGLLGSIGFVAMLWGVWRSVSRAWYSASLPPREKPLGALLISLAAFYLVYGLVDTPLLNHATALPFWGVVGVLLGWSAQIQENREDYSQ